MHENRILPRSEYGSYIASFQGRCVFCNSRDLLLKEFPGWKWMWSKFPYRKYHTLLVPHRHVTTLPELETSEFESLRVSLRDISETYKKASELEGSDIPSSQLVFSWRERTDSTQEKQSVSHMHMHIYPAMAVDASLNLDPEAFKIRRELIESRL